MSLELYIVIWCTSISQKDFKDGLVYKNEGVKRQGATVDVKFDGEYYDGKLLWVLENYSRFVRPGMVRLACKLSEEQSMANGLLVSAYKDVQNGNVIYMLTNLSQVEVKMNFREKEKAKTYISDADHNLELTIQKLNKVIIPVRSLVTVLK
jgi:hypothetical protein